MVLFPLTGVAIGPSEVSDADHTWDANHTVELLSLMVVVGSLTAGFLLLPFRGKRLILYVVGLLLSSVVAFNVFLDYMEWEFATERGALDSAPPDTFWAWICAALALVCAWEIWKAIRGSTHQTVVRVRFGAGIILRIVGIVLLMLFSGGLIGDIEDGVIVVCVGAPFGLWGAWAVYRLRRHPVSVDDKERWNSAIAYTIKVSPYLAVGAWCLGFGVSLGLIVGRGW